MTSELDQLRARSQEACETCARECESALDADPSYTSPGTEPYGEHQLSLVTCVSVCTLTARALEVGNAEPDLVAWCADVCQSTADMLDERTPAWRRVLTVCFRCAAQCRRLAAGMRGAAASRRFADSCI